jgi:hypothetical protein
MSSPVTIRVKHVGHEWTLRELAIAHGLDPCIVRGRYDKGKRGEELVAPAQVKRYTREFRYQGLL